ncbi:MAG: M20 aminoacylase family protein [Myxococcota bacterium]
MVAVPEIERLGDEMTAWRRDLHAHPELAFEEVRTSGMVAEKLASWGLEVHRGLAKTGVVGVLRGSGGEGPMIGLRADMDALPMQEANTFEHASTVAGKMHGCGHDGHTTMLLGAAKFLSENRDFRGSVAFIFQPAEEGHGGGREMVREGLFDRFPCELVFGMHNWPELPTGEAAVMPGAMMAASDSVELVITGKGGHAAMPHLSVDPVVVSAHVITALQTLTSRSVNPVNASVVSICDMHAGVGAGNVIPQTVRLKGTARAFDEDTRRTLEEGIERIATHVAQGLGAEAMVKYQRGYPPTVNDPAQAELAATVLGEMLGAENVHRDLPPCMGGEDFAFMLEKRPGAYIWMGQAGGPSGCMVHNPRYDFNDAILPIGASYWAKLVERVLGS